MIFVNRHFACSAVCQLIHNVYSIAYFEGKHNRGKLIPDGHPDCNGHSTLFDGVPWLPGEPGVRDMCVFNAPEEAGVYMAELDLDMLRKHRANDIMGDKYRHPDKYSAICSI